MVVLPSFGILSSFCFSVWVSNVGEITQGRMYFYNSRSHLSEPVLMIAVFDCLVVGEITQGS